MKECPRCGREFGDSIKYCSFCGIELKIKHLTTARSNSAPTKENQNSSRNSKEAIQRQAAEKQPKEPWRTILGFIFAALLIGFFVFGAILFNRQLDQIPFRYTLHSGPEPLNSMGSDYTVPVSDSVFNSFRELNDGLAPGDTLQFFANKKSVLLNIDESQVYEIKSSESGGKGIFIVPPFRVLGFRVLDKADKDLHILIRAQNWQWHKSLLEALKRIFYMVAIMAIVLFICSHLLDVASVILDNDRRATFGLKFKTVFHLSFIIAGLVCFLGALELWPDWRRLSQLKDSEQQMGIAPIFIARIPEVFAPYDRLYLWSDRRFGVMLDNDELKESFSPSWHNISIHPFSSPDASLTLKPNIREVRVACAASEVEREAAEKYKGGIQEAFLQGQEVILSGHLYYRLERSGKRWAATYIPSVILILLAILSFSGGIILISKKMREADRKEKIKAMEKELKERTSQERVDKLRQKFDELRFEAERSAYERNDEFRINYVFRHMDQILGDKNIIEEEHKEFFYKDKEFLEYCRQNGGEDIIDYKAEPFERLKMALDLDLRRPVPGSIQEQMSQAIEKIWVDESSGLLRVALRKDFTKRYAEIGDFSDALSIIEDSYNKIRDNSNKRLRGVH